MPKATKGKQKKVYTTSNDHYLASHNVLRPTKHRLRHGIVNIEVAPIKHQESCSSLNREQLEFGMGSIPGGWESEVSKEADGEEPGNIKVKTKTNRKRYEDSDAPLLTWSHHHRDEYLDWNLVTEGRGRLFHNDPVYARCLTSNTNYQCQDCFGLRMLCKECILEKHLDDPLHIIMEWKQDFFRLTSLRSLGLRIQLGHLPGKRCNFPVDCPHDFTVLAWNGIHTISVDFCGCTTAPDRHLQLMEMGLWPSSYKDPRSASTIQLLRNFHTTNLHCQTPPTDFYEVLQLLSDGTGLQKLLEREAQWMTMLHQFRNIKMAKRCGRGHHPEGIKGTSYGEAAVPCRACPHPERNIPVGWDNVPVDDQFLYALYLSEDANFKQKARARPNDSSDPPLGPGWGCFIPNDPYMTEINKRATQEEINHCVRFKAISTANTKKTKGLRATGIGAVSCARHKAFRANGMGDLQVGERYVNMDFLALFTLVGCTLSLVFFSYDIACQWVINFHSRMANFPEYMHLPDSMKLIFKVPKFHLVAHARKCLAKFWFTYTEGGTKTDGEGIERNWSWLNSCSRSLSMMKASARWDTLDDFTNFWNWRKTANLGTILLKKMVKAIPEAVVSAHAFAVFGEALQGDHAEDLLAWQDQVVKWEQGLSTVCPYGTREETLTLAQVKKDLAEEEHEREATGMNTTISTLSGLVIEALEIEETQQSIRALMTSKKKLTDFQHCSRTKRQTSLLQRVRKYQDSLLIHIPSIRPLIEAEPLSKCSNPETMELFLPSSLNTQSHALLPAELIQLEDRLWFAQAYESLSQLRSQLRSRSVVYKNTSRLQPSQGMYTKMNALQDRIEARIGTYAATYRVARAALLQTRQEGEWMNSLKDLRDEDIRGISERVLKEKEREDWRVAQERSGVSANAIDEVLNEANVPTVSFNPILSLGQSKQMLSWIWYTHITIVGGEKLADGASFEEIQDSLRSEWCKARAHARRPQEELRLVEEEMRRSIEYCYYAAGWWENQVGRREDVSLFLREGLTAYAKEHAHVERDRGLHWSQLWHPIREQAKVILSHLSDPRYNAMLPYMAPLEVEVEVDEDEEREDLEDIDS